jgi:RHH-type proline utilization regulon transcriptional repressor/proline dehydrogenase/delta 1-pyrroline-5-carboxylate dehydrogenase
MRPVGAHRDLLAYLVRRLLENGANSSFVNQIVDACPAGGRRRRPGGAGAGERRRSEPAIRLPRDLFQPGRENSKGYRPGRAGERAGTHRGAQPLRRHALDGAAGPGRRRRAGGGRQSRAFAGRRPIWSGRCTRQPRPKWTRPRRGAGGVRAMVRHAGRGARGGAAPDRGSLRGTSAEFCAIAAREAGKTCSTAWPRCARRSISCATTPKRSASRPRSRARRAASSSASALELPAGHLHRPDRGRAGRGQRRAGETGRTDAHHRHARGGAVPRGRRAAAALQLLPGDGPTVGAPLTSDPRIAGVCFTGSTETAQRIYTARWPRMRRRRVLIAETGGLNAMIVDSTALPEQAVDDIVASSFQSAGQRCSALRCSMCRKRPTG